MKIVSWGIIFVVVIFSFSFVNRTILNNKMDIMKEEVRYNNALTQATNDATQEISNQMNNGDTNVNESYQMVLSAVDKFFETFSLSTGYYGGNQKDSIMKMYVPSIAIMTYDGFYISSLENVENRLEHTLKPETGYTYNDTTDKYINFTLDNYVKINKNVNIFDDQLQEYKNISEGYIVDLRHKDDIENATNGVYVEEHTVTGGKYIGQEIRYEKSFYTMSHVRYLLEEWYQVTAVGETLINKRMTRYTEEDYQFTNRLKEKGYSDSIVKGNPENDGFIDPITGEYTIGAFNKIRRETITRQVTEKMQYYILLHNKFAQANGITYTFTLPEIKETDWENAIQDVSVFAFVQGISLLDQEYYNNYSFSGARIVDKEVYYGIPPEEDATNPFSDTNLPVYYSSRRISETNRYLFERNNARIFNSREDAADYGYYPNVNNSSAVADRVVEEVLNFSILKEGLNCVKAGDVISIPIILPESTIPAEIKWANGNQTRNYFLASGNIANSGTNTVNYKAGTVIDEEVNKTINNGTNISWEYKQKAGKTVIFAVMNVGLAPNGTTAHYTIFVRDIAGNSLVKTVSLSIVNDMMIVNQTTPKTDTDDDANNLINGTFSNRTWENILLDNNDNYMAYYMKGDPNINSSYINSYYDSLKDGNIISGVSRLINTGNSNWQFSVSEYGVYTVFGWDCTGAAFRGKIIIFPSMQITYKIDAYNESTLVETLKYDALGNLISGSIDIEQQVTRGVATVTINRTDAELTYAEYKKGNYDVVANTSAGIQKYEPSTGTNIKGTYTFEITENNYYTVYVEDVGEAKDCVQINFELITSAFEPNFNDWIIPDINYQMESNTGNNYWYSHYNPPISIVDSRTMEFGSYYSENYRDVIFEKSSSKYEIVFRYTINDSEISYHSSKGSGFLFDCKVTESVRSDGYKDYNMSGGYLLLYEQSSINLYKVGSTNLTTIRTDGCTLTLVTSGTKLSGGIHETRLEIRQINDTQQSLILKEKNSSGLWQVLINTNINNTKKQENAYGVIMMHNSHSCSQRSKFRFNNMSIVQKEYID